MNIVYAGDDNFAEILGISMISLFENNTECDCITVYILDDGIGDDNKEKLNSIGEKYNRKLIFMPIPNLHELAGVEIHTNSRWSLSTFSRLFLEKILPEAVEQVIYLDCDILVMDSLENLFNMDLKDYCCGAVFDCISDGHKANVGLNSNDNYFNAGVMLISLRNWRKENLFMQFTDFINRYNGNTPYVDQGVINGVISRKIKPIDVKYNCYTVLFDFSYEDMLKYRKPSKYYSEQEVLEAKKNPVIVHFTTSFLSFRPWVEGCKHPYAADWIKYKMMSPWADVPMRKDNSSVKKKLAVKIYSMLPKKIAVNLAGLLHAEIVPRIRRKNNEHKI